MQTRHLLKFLIKDDTGTVMCLWWLDALTHPQLDCIRVHFFFFFNSWKKKVGMGCEAESLDVLVVLELVLEVLGPLGVLLEEIVDLFERQKKSANNRNA